MNTHHPIHPETTTQDMPELEEAARCLALVEPELDAIAPEQYVRITTDVALAVKIALGALPALRGLAPSIEALPGIDSASIGKLEQYAQAALFAHLSALPPGTADGTLQQLLDEAVPLRDKLLVSAEPLARAGVIENAKIDAIRLGSGRLDTASDLIALAGVYHDAWAAIDGRTLVTSEDIERAARLGMDLFRVLAKRDGAEPTAASKAADRKARAFTRFVNVYEQARRAVTFLRWDEGDVDTILPTLFPKSRRAKKTEPAPSPEPAPASPS